MTCHALSPATVLVSTLFHVPTRARRSPSLHITSEVLRRLAETPSAIALIEGPGGSGKSSLLRRIARHAARSGLRVVMTLRSDALVRTRTIDHLCDLLPGADDSTGMNALKSALELLTTCGLGEPALWLRRACALSDSEQGRFTIACALARAGVADANEHPFLIVIDEFLSTLDRITAQATARAILRLSRARPALRLLAATAHADLGAFLEPTFLVRHASGGAA